MIRLFAAPIVSLALVAAPAIAQEIAVGARLPAQFKAVDATGKPRDYRAIRGRAGTVLVLFRSAKWCPYCQAQLKDLRALQPELTRRGYSLAAMSYDPVPVLADFGKRQAIGYTLLSDDGSRMIDALGMRDPTYPKGNFAYGVPKATILVIDPAGTVRQKLVASDYKIRPGNAAILAAVDAPRR